MFHPSVAQHFNRLGAPSEVRSTVPVSKLRQARADRRSLLTNRIHLSDRSAQIHLDSWFGNVAVHRPLCIMNYIKPFGIFADILYKTPAVNIRKTSQTFYLTVRDGFDRTRIGIHFVNGQGAPVVS